MFASAVYPLLMAALVSSRPMRWQIAAVAVGYALALLIGVSRLMIGVHSWSEVLAGLALGGAVSAIALALAHTPRTRAPILMPIGLALWLSVTPAQAPPSQTHSMATRLALALSGRPEPYTRRDMLRAYERRRQQASASAWR
jgi:membrane-associated phospholipid phosphatase